jgi:PEP-CTERM motif
MNPTSAQLFSKRPPQRGGRVSCVLSAALCIFFLTAVPAMAEPVRFSQVVQTLTSSQGIPDLRMNALLSQDPGTSKAGTQQSGRGSETQALTQGGDKNDSLISGVAVTGVGQRIGIDIIEEGEVEGTICDCGDILVAGGSFAKWPFLFLAAVPLVFINDCESCNETPTSTPTPTPPSNATPTPTPTPEPGSLFLFGSGLVAAGAGLRRRYARAKLVAQLKTRREE